MKGPKQEGFMGSALILAVYKMGIYSLGPPISVVDLYFLCALRLFTMGAYSLGPLIAGVHVILSLRSGGLHSQGLYSRVVSPTTDFGSACPDSHAAME